MSEHSAINHFVLVVDNDAVVSQSISDFIHSKGYNVIICDNLEDAFFEIAINRIDLILVNFFQSDGTALTLLENLRQLNKEIPVVVVTDKKEPQAFLDCFKMGVLDFVVKPINVELFWYKAEILLTRIRLQEKVKQQSVELEKMLYEKAREEQLARHIFEHLVNVDNSQFDFIKSFSQASANFSGDILLNSVSPNGNLFIMLADSTGHGLSAAMPIMRVASTFNAMVSKCFSLVTLIYELNEKLFYENPDDRFVACILLEADLFRNKLYVWNGGMPPVFLHLRHNNQSQDNNSWLNKVFKSTNMALGILPPNTFIADIVEIDLPHEGYACLYSDGLIEQPLFDNSQFGMERLNALFHEKLDSLPYFFKENFDNNSLDNHIVDDISVCTLDFQRLHDWYRSQDVRHLLSNKNGEFDWDIKLSGPMLLSADYLSMLNQFLSAFGFATYFCQRVFTVVAELFSNAIDHGVLKLDSRLKNDPEGFELYHSIRDGCADRLTSNDWVKVSITWNDRYELLITVSDSGKGFTGFDKSISNYPELSGRGLSLVKKLCKHYELISPGNITKVVME
ncbi:SpoIIE family protein phosphatase [Shewanella xiamenensis]|uniref:SpoIIE family protein phosphatase n=1 Tax=Shewanella xiamenensis TaxID=332186 RepID=UPI0004D34EB0|nr:SpoIIE family protein phosphatase [Shewanella xiamenensis]KEK28503.1 response regulator [Shewanella xiamenensis]